VHPPRHHKRNRHRPLARLCQTITACSHRRLDVPFHPRRGPSSAPSVVSLRPIAACRAATHREQLTATALLPARHQHDPTAATTLPISADRPYRSHTSPSDSRANVSLGLRQAMGQHEMHGRLWRMSPLDRTASQMVHRGRWSRKESSTIALWEGDGAHTARLRNGGGR
jgi:hypothetical protein